MPINYFSNAEGTLASRLDSAWEDYRDESLSKKARIKASRFMVYALDIQTLSEDKDALNKQFEILTHLTHGTR